MGVSYCSEMMSRTRHPGPESSSGDSGSPEMLKRVQHDVVHTIPELLPLEHPRALLYNTRVDSIRKNFIRVPEDFVCENCGARVEGSGYTNHCPKCLYSRHVDEETPGDRRSSCGGLMAPIALDQRHGEYVITHRCLRCGKVARNKVDTEDDHAALVDLARSQI